MRYNKKPIRLTKHNFKSRWEEKVYDWLPKKNTKYESLKLKYSLDRTYLPDFIVERKGHPDLILEAKGYLRPTDRTKMIAVKEANPNADIRFVFSQNNKLHKNSKTTYLEWAKKNGFPACVGKVPHAWLYPPKYDPDYSKNWYEKNKERHLLNGRKRVLKKLYGITFEDWDKMYLEQNGKCSICSVSFDTLPRKPDVDHCHETGKVRGLLCWTCNGGLGQYNDDPALLRKAAEYLEKFK